MSKLAIKEINKAKTKLQKVKQIYENFGNKEIRNIENKFEFLRFPYSLDEEQKKAYNLFSEFKEWCYTFNGAK